MIEPVLTCETCRTQWRHARNCPTCGTIHPDFLGAKVSDAMHVTGNLTVHTPTIIVSNNPQPEEPA